MPRPLFAACVCRSLILLGLMLSMAAVSSDAAASEPRHGYSLFGDLELPVDFGHFDFVNPEAPRGGRVTFPGFNTFDSFNPFILRGNAPGFVNLLWDALTVRHDDETSAQYGLVAETIEMADDGTWVEFTLRSEARFHDGSPITAADVVWTFETLREKGTPRTRALYANVASIEQTGEAAVRFTFPAENGRELALMLGNLRPLPRHYWSEREFDETTLEPPLGSGPYRIREFEAGSFIIFERVEDYWAADLPIRVGHYNIDEVKIDYFRDLDVLREATRAGILDWFPEEDPKDWLSQYNIPARDEGLFRLEIIRTENPEPMRGIALNTRRSIFSDIRVREAMDYAYNFAWMQRYLMFDWFVRTQSYFQDSYLQATGLPDEAELELLEPWRDQLPAQLFEQPFRSPEGDIEGPNRADLRVASRLLEEAGWILENGVRVNEETGEVFTIDVLLVLAPYERMFAAYFQALRLLGIEAQMRTVDAALYQSRVGEFDYDMMMTNYFLSLTPGEQLWEFFGSVSADRQYAQNWSGAASPAIDDLIDHVIAAESTSELTTAAHALDRALLWNRYVVPGFHRPGNTFVYWDKFGRPERNPRFSDGFWETWWYDPERAARVEAFQDQ